MVRNSCLIAVLALSISALPGLSFASPKHKSQVHRIYPAVYQGWFSGNTTLINGLYCGVACTVSIGNFGCSITITNKLTGTTTTTYLCQ